MASVIVIIRYLREKWESFLCALFLLHPFLLCSQDQAVDSLIEPEWTTAYFQVTYGSMAHQKVGTLPLNSIKDFNPGQPMEYVGISFYQVYHGKNGHEGSTRYSYHRIIPTDIYISSLSVRSEIRGGSFSALLPAIDLTPRSTVFSSLLGCGFNTGRIVIAPDEYRTRKNPYFAPAIFLEPHFFMGHLSLGLRFGYQIDISRPGWKDAKSTHEKPQIDLEPFRQSGFSAHIGLGWKFE